MITENNGLFRKQVVSTAAANNQVVMLAASMRDVTVVAKGGGAGNKVQKSYSAMADVVAGTADWVDLMATVTNAAYDDTHRIQLGTDTCTAVRAVRTDADVTMIVMAKPGLA